MSYLRNDLNAARSGPQAHGRILTTFLPSIVKMRLRSLRGGEDQDRVM